MPVRLQARPIRIHNNGEPEGVGHYWNHRPYRVPDAAYLVSARRGPGGLRAPILPEGSAHQNGSSCKTARISGSSRSQRSRLVYIRYAFADLWEQVLQGGYGLLEGRGGGLVGKARLRGMCVCYTFRISSMTAVHSCCPRVQMTVASSASSPSGMMHLMSSGLGQGHSLGLATHVSVPGQRYSAHETKSKSETRIQFERINHTTCRVRFPLRDARILLSLLLLLLLLREHVSEEVRTEQLRAELAETRR